MSSLVFFLPLFFSFAQKISTKLVDELDPEKSRWVSNLSVLENEKDNVIGNCLLTASFLTYTGCFSMSFRKEMIFDDWLCDIHTRNIPIGDVFDVLDLNDIGSYVSLQRLRIFFPLLFIPFACTIFALCVPSYYYEHASRASVSVIVYFYLNCRSFDGGGGAAGADLLADEFFKQNRMILSKTLRTPICIDPQFKAIECIKAAHQRQNNVKFLRFDADDTIGELLKAIALGEVVVFEDVHAHIDPTLMDLLEIKLLLSWFPSFSPFSTHIHICLLTFCVSNKFFAFLFFLSYFFFVRRKRQS